jgi:hypothetical protein
MGTCLYGVLLLNKPSRKGTFRSNHAQPACETPMRKYGTEATVESRSDPSPPLNGRCSPSLIELREVSSKFPPFVVTLCNSPWTSALMIPVPPAKCSKGEWQDGYTSPEQPTDTGATDQSRAIVSLSPVRSVAALAGRVWDLAICGTFVPISRGAVALFPFRAV